MCEQLVLQHPLKRVANCVAPCVPRHAIEFFAAAAQCFHLVCSHKFRINPYLDVVSGDL